MKNNSDHFEKIAKEIVSTAISETLSGSGEHHSDIDYDKLVERITHALVAAHNKAIESAAENLDAYLIAGDTTAGLYAAYTRRLKVKK